jgi:FAD/FMN-containing dehydrogenase
MVGENIALKFRNIVGENNFFDAPEVLEAYSKDYSFAPARKPLFVIKPKNTNEIKQIIDLANETLTPIIPTSSGFPKFHGDTIPIMSGIVVNLSDLDQVLKIDRRNRVAMIEPGVTFNSLRMALKDSGMVPYTPLLPRSTKSILASYLEREPIMIPKDHWNFNDPIAGGEVVIGDGHVQGFGDTAGHSKVEIARGDVIPVCPSGPGAIGWLTMIQGAQGTLGIVPWSVVRCRIRPCIQRPFFISAQALKDIIPFLQKVLRPRFAEELFILNAFGLASILSEEPGEIRKFQASLPAWVLFLNIAGFERYPEEEVEWKEERLKEFAVREGVELKDAVGGVSALSLLGTLEKAADKDRRLRYKSSCQILPFETTLDRTPELATLLKRVAGDYEYPSGDMSIYIQPVIQGCQCQCEVVFPYNSKDVRELETVKNLFPVVAKKMSEKGAYYSRPYGMLAEMVYKDTAVVDILRKIKSILDPNDIMNSGKLCYLTSTHREAYELKDM